MLGVVGIEERKTLGETIGEEEWKEIKGKESGEGPQEADMQVDF